MHIGKRKRVEHVAAKSFCVATSALDIYPEMESIHMAIRTVPKYSHTQTLRAVSASLLYALCGATNIFGIESFCTLNVRHPDTLHTMAFDYNLSLLVCVCYLHLLVFTHFFSVFIARNKDFLNWIVAVVCVKYAICRANSGRVVFFYEFGARFFIGI